MAGDGGMEHNGGAGRPRGMKLILVLAIVLVAGLAGVRFAEPSLIQPMVLGLLSLLAVAGVFFLFAALIGVIRFSGSAQKDTQPFDLLDKLGAGYAVVENDRIIYANTAYKAFFPQGEVQTVERLFSGIPEVSEPVYRLAQAARDQRSAVEEVRLVPALVPGRDYAWYRLQVKPVKSAGRNAALWEVADVTRDRQRQEDVFQELQHAIDYLDHAPAGFLSVEQSGAVVYMNATLAEWLDYDLAQVGSGGLDLNDIVANSAAAMLVPVAGKPGDLHTETFDVDLRKRNGESLPVRLYHRIACGIDGRPGASRTLVLNRASALERGESEPTDAVPFARFFNNTPIAIATVTREGSLLQANAAFSRLFGAVPRLADGTGQQVRDWIAPAQRDEFDTAIASAAMGRAGAQPLELNIAGDGERSARVWVSGEGESAILYALDTTEFRQVEEQLVQAQKMNAIGQLAGGVAHDFNNVLQAIIGYCDLLLGNHRPTDPSFQDIMQIKQNANRAASLVRQLLAFSRRQTLLPEVLNLSDRLSDLSMFLKRLLGERVDLDFRHGRDLWPVLADVHQLEQVMMNLAVNARDAMPDGGQLGIRTANIPAEEAARLSVPGMPAGDYVLIETSDTGTGMPPQVIEKIFEPFFTTKDIGKGTGLGLSTVFGIVKQSGGFIDVRSIIGEGTTFSIYLPRHAVVESEVEPDIRPATPSAPAADMTGQGVILLVEDEDPVRAVNARALTARGYTVLEAASGVEALQIISEREIPVDLVISDVVMPEMDGPTLLGELRKQYADLKVIFVSGYAEEAFRKHLPDGESFNFLPKPFGLKQLVETVKQVMRG